MFTEVWGCGEEVASQWYGLGCRTLEDVRRRAAQDGEPGGIHLTPQQEVGSPGRVDYLIRVPLAGWLLVLLGGIHLVPQQEVGWLAGRHPPVHSLASAPFARTPYVCF